MKKFWKIIVAICFLSLLACSRYSNNNFSEKYTFTFTEDGIDVIQKEGKNYPISNAVFYNGSFYFTIVESEYNNGEFLATSSIYKANMNTKTISQLFSDDFTSNYEDKIYIKDNTLIYLNQSNSYLNAINLKNLSKLKDFYTPVDAAVRLYSSDLNKIFDSYFGGINIQDFSTAYNSDKIEGIELATYDQSTINQGLDITNILGSTASENEIKNIYEIKDTSSTPKDTTYTIEGFHLIVDNQNNIVKELVLAQDSIYNINGIRIGDSIDKANKMFGNPISSSEGVKNTTQYIYKYSDVGSTRNVILSIDNNSKKIGYIEVSLN